MGEEYSIFLDSYRSPPVTGLRINPLKIDPEKFEALAPFELEPVSWCNEGFILCGEGRPGKHPYHAAGLYYLQDPSAMLAAELLDPQPGEIILDLAAAPGGKATHIISKMENRGLFFANEIHPKRVWELAQNLERWGALNTVIVNDTPQRLADKLEGYFDKVLLDAPCSGEGMFRKSETARCEWSLEVVKSCATRQQGILHQASRLVKPGGRLVYATCTFSPEENEYVIANFLDSHKNFSLVEPIVNFNAQKGHSEWIENALIRSDEIKKTLRCWHHHGMPEGHFYAILRRSDDGFLNKFTTPSQQPFPKEIEKLYDDFVEQNLVLNHSPKVLRFIKSQVYLIPEKMPDTGDLRIIRPGLWVGQVKGTRFEPAHALALAIKADNARHIVDLDSNGREVLAYLYGEQLFIGLSCDNGWSLITVDGFPLGWGKQSGKVIKNYYPKGLRWV